MKSAAITTAPTAAACAAEPNWMNAASVVTTVSAIWPT